MIGNEFQEHSVFQDSRQCLAASGLRKPPLTEIVCPDLFQFHAFLSPGRCPLFLHTHVHTCSSQATESGTNILFFNSKCLGGSVPGAAIKNDSKLEGGGIKQQKYIFPQFWEWKSKIKVPPLLGPGEISLRGLQMAPSPSYGPPLAHACREHLLSFPLLIRPPILLNYNSTLMTSCNLNYLLRVSSPKQTH